MLVLIMWNWRPPSKVFKVKYYLCKSRTDHAPANYKYSRSKTITTSNSERSVKVNLCDAHMQSQNDNSHNLYNKRCTLTQNNTWINTLLCVYYILNCYFSLISKRWSALVLLLYIVISFDIILHSSINAQIKVYFIKEMCSCERRVKLCDDCHHRN